MSRVGDIVNVRGELCRIMHISKVIRSEIIGLTREEFIDSRIAPQSRNILGKWSVEEFEPTDVISSEYTEVKMEPLSPLKGLTYAYPTYIVKKERSLDDERRSETEDGETSDSETENSGEGDQSPSSLGEPGVGEGGGTRDEDGRGGEGGVVVHPGQGEGSEPTDAECGSGVEGGSVCGPDRI